jgi:antitoxin (DNA-binding transcriptional repressor) of toxin-antitoxin stability system
MKASIVDLRYRMKDVLRAIDRGETVTVLYRGKEKAKLVPINGTQLPKKTLKSTDHPAFGMWKDREDMKDPAKWLQTIRRSRIRDL